MTNEEQTREALQQEIVTLQQRVAELEAERERYATIIQHLPVGLFVYQLEDPQDDRTLRMLDANPMVGTLAGVEPSAVIGKTLDKNFPGLREQGIPQAYAQVINSGEPFSTEVVYGDERVIESAFGVQAFPLPGQCMGVTFENITQRKQAEQEVRLLNAELEQRVIEKTEELQRSQTLLHGFLQYSPAIIFARDIDGRYLLVNKQYESILNIAEAEIIGKMPHDLFAEETAAQLLQHDQQAIEQGAIVQREELIPHHDDDNLHTYIAVKFPIYNTEGDLYAIGGISTDITEQKRAEQALARESEMNLALTNLARAILTQSSVDDISSMVLEYARTLTESPSGFVGYIDPRTGFLVAPTLTRDMWDVCRVEDKQFVFETFNGLWGWVLNERCSLLTNAPASDVRSGGVPAGHLAIQRFLGAPALIGDETLVGMIAMANAERDYAEHDIELLERLASLYAITIQRTQAEEELRTFKALADNSPDGVAVADFDGQMVYANAALKTMLGYGEQTLEHKMSDFHAPEAAEQLPQIMDTLTTHGCWQGVVMHCHRDGHTIPTQASVTVIYDRAGKPQKHTAILHDITQQQKQQEIIRAGAQRLQAIIDKIPVGVCITDEYYRFEYVNPAYCETYHYTTEELIGQPFTTVVPADYHATARQLHDDFMREKAEIRGEWHVLTKEGDPLTILADAAAITGEDGQPKKVTFVVDITALKAAEQEQQRLQQQVIEAQQAAIRELSTPLIPLSSKVVLMPLIGSIDSGRAQMVMEALLEGIAEHQADVAILDITGVAVVDTQVANALVQAAQAVRLLGANVILTGIGPTMAQTLVHLGADLSSISTRGSLQSAVFEALRESASGEW